MHWFTRFMETESGPRVKDFKYMTDLEASKYVDWDLGALREAVARCKAVGDRWMTWIRSQTGLEIVPGLRIDFFIQYSTMVDSESFYNEKSWEAFETQYAERFFAGDYFYGPLTSSSSKSRIKKVSSSSSSSENLKKNSRLQAYWEGYKDYETM